MPAPSEAQVVEFEGWTLRVRPALTKSAHLLLLLHGWTGDENSMWVFAQAFPEDCWVLAPRAPFPTRPSGYSWRVPAPNRSDGPKVDDLLSSAEALIGVVDGYLRAQGTAVGTIDVVGFSQGAALASVVALTHPERVAKIALLSGFVPAGAEWLAPGRRLDGVRFFVAHGSADKMVSIQHARQSVQVLEAAGASVTVCEAEVGHKVSAGCLRGLQAFLLG